MAEGGASKLPSGTTEEKDERDDQIPEEQTTGTIDTTDTSTTENTVVMATGTSEDLAMKSPDELITEPVDDMAAETTDQVAMETTGEMITGTTDEISMETETKMTEGIPDEAAVRPRVSLGQGNVEDLKSYEVLIINNLQNVDSLIPTKLEIDMKDKIVSFGDHQKLMTKEMRYASSQKLPSSLQPCFTVSYLSVDTVCNVFLKPKSAGDLNSICSDLEYVIMSKFDQWQNQQNDISQCQKIIQEQPLFCDWVDIEVYKGQNPHLPSERFFMLVDPECMLLYKNDFTEAQHVVWFIEEAGENVVERIMIDHLKSCLVFETKTTTYQMKESKSFVDLLKKLKPKGKGLMADPYQMMSYVQRSNPQGPAGTRVKPENWGNWRTTQDVFRAPFKKDDNEDDYRFPGAKATSDAAEGSSFYNLSVPGVEGSKVYAPDFEDDSVYKLQNKMDSALRQFQDNEDFQAMWVAKQFDIEAIIATESVPYSDFSSGGLSETNVNHLQRAFDDVQTFLNDDNLEMAVSRMQACRRFYGSSSNMGIAAIFRDSDVELLMKLYFLSLCS